MCLRTGFRALFVALALSACSSSPSGASTLPDRFSDQVVTGGLNDPVGFAFTPDGRMVVAERAGALRFIVEGKLGAVDPMIVIDSVATDGDRGLTGVAVDPQWPTRPFIYVYYDNMNGSCRIERYTAEGDLNSSSGIYLTIDPASRFRLIADIPDLQNLHNGGTLRFGPDGMLYAALGDDGDGCAAQDTTSLRGVMLRMDVRGLPPGPGGPPYKDLLVPSDNPLVAYPNPNARLIYANGLRNPFRFHIDPVDGDIFIADVGFQLFEEVDVIDSGLQNFGWPYYEGPAGFVGSCPGIVQGGALTSPIYAYDRTGFTAAVISAGVYRGSTCTLCNFPAEYEGDYFLSDFYAGFLRRLKLVDGQWFLAAPVPGQPTAQDWGLGFDEVSDYLVGPDGALWYCKFSYDFTPGTGEIHRIYYTPPVNDATTAAPRDLSFAPPAPMPARGPVRFSWTQPLPADVALRVYDPQGRLTRTVLAPGTQPAGTHEARWNGDDDDGVRAAPGVYLAQLVVGGHALQRRVVLVR